MKKSRRRLQKRQPYMSNVYCPVHTKRGMPCPSKDCRRQQQQARLSPSDRIPRVANDRPDPAKVDMSVEGRPVARICPGAGREARWGVFFSSDFPFVLKVD